MENLPVANLLRSPQEYERIAAAEYALANPKACRDWVVQLVQAAGDSCDLVSITATETLEVLGDPSPVHLPSLISIVREQSNGESVYWAVTMIGRLGPVAASATPALIEALVDSEFLPVQERAAWALARIGPAAAAATNALREAAENGPPRLRRLANQALESLRGMAA